MMALATSPVTVPSASLEALEREESRSDRFEDGIDQSRPESH
jgi:hypothetical protein